MKRAVQVIDDPSSDSLLLVMEYVAGGSLEQAPVRSQYPSTLWVLLFVYKCAANLACEMRQQVFARFSDASAQVGPPAARRWAPLPEAITLRYVQEICQVQAPACRCHELTQHPKCALLPAQLVVF